MRSAKSVLLDLIHAEGPISVHTFMEFCLNDLEFGYYHTQPVFGQTGDFITAPEISQMFGELLGLWLAQSWVEQGRPKNFILLELGPGKGTLMADVLRATATVAGFHDAMTLCLFESSEQLRMMQKEKLLHYSVRWETDLTALPNRPLFFVANEFFDTLPIHQYQRTGDIWLERMVAAKGEDLEFSVSRTPAQVPYMLHKRIDISDGDIVEFCPDAGRICATLSANIEKHGGAGVIIDYGNWASRGDTLQAVKNHKTVGVFDAPGNSDLTAHVDFEALQHFSNCAVSPMIPQGLFLEQLGITERANVLAEYLRDEALEFHIAAHRRLTHPDEMGTLFKMMTFCPSGRLTPTGF